jgi:hypothetical protein
MVDKMGKLAAKKAATGAAASEGPSPVDVITQGAVARLRLGWAQRSGAHVTRAAVGLGVPAEPSSGGEVSAGPVAGEAGVGADGAAAAPSPPVHAITSHAVATAVAKALPDHPDARALASTNPFMSVVVAGHKYDAIRDADLPKRRAVVAALRYLAHCYSAHLVTTSTRDKGTLGVFRAVMGHCVFGSEGRRAPAVDLNRPIVVPAGSDSLEGIGLPVAVPGVPPVARADVEAGPFTARFQRFLTPVKHFFPPAAAPAAGAAGGVTSEEPVDPDDVDPATLPPTVASIAPGVPVTFSDEASRFVEPVIDALRVSKAEEVGRYAREVDRRLKMEAKAQAAAGAGAGGSST